MKRVQKILMTLFWVQLTVALVVVVMFETGMCDSGTLAGRSSQTEFLMTTLMELVTIASIPLALRLFKFQHVSRQLHTEGHHALLTYGVLRLALLEVPMLVNTLLYYIYMNTTFGYMAIICALCLPFVYPGMERCLEEVGGEA